MVRSVPQVDGMAWASWGLEAGEQLGGQARTVTAHPTVGLDKGRNCGGWVGWT